MWNTHKIRHYPPFKSNPASTPSAQPATNCQMNDTIDRRIVKRIPCITIRYFLAFYSHIYFFHRHCVFSGCCCCCWLHRISNGLSINWAPIENNSHQNPTIINHLILHTKSIMKLNKSVHTIYQPTNSEPKTNEESHMEILK